MDCATAAGKGKAMAATGTGFPPEAKKMSKGEKRACGTPDLPVFIRSSAALSHGEHARKRA
jgi:hypothetical protein